MRNYRELQVWQKGIDIVIEVYRITEQLPKEERFNLISQLNRAAVSVPSNIAEGCGRGTDAAFIQFLEYAFGSVFEIETQIFVVQRLKLLPIDELRIINQLTDEEGKMINSLISSLR
jgi:four helix bundle protein